MEMMPPNDTGVDPTPDRKPRWKTESWTNLWTFCIAALTAILATAAIFAWREAKRASDTADTALALTKRPVVVMDCIWDNTFLPDEPLPDHGVIYDREGVHTLLPSKVPVYDASGRSLGLPRIFIRCNLQNAGSLPVTDIVIHFGGRVLCFGPGKRSGTLPLKNVTGDLEIMALTPNQTYPFAVADVDLTWTAAPQMDQTVTFYTPASDDRQSYKLRVSKTAETLIGGYTSLPPTSHSNC